MATLHEEADNIIAQQVIICTKQQPCAVSVITDDTDVFMLLLHHYQNESYLCHVHDIAGSAKVYDRRQGHCGKTQCQVSGMLVAACVVGL